MYAIDFEYDGQCLSDYKFIICDFSSQSSPDIIKSSAAIKFEKNKKEKGLRNRLTMTRYESCVTSTFDICKDPSCYHGDDMIISGSEFREIARWLSRPEFLKFKVLYDNDTDGCNSYYMASFNVDKILIADRLCGIRLSMETDCPFAYGDIIIEKLAFSGPSNFVDVEDMSDRIGCINPDLIIKCNASGTLTVLNSTLNCSMSIKNCTAGEIIKISGSEQIITTSLDSHKIYNDFNYQFLELGNTFDSRVNRLSASIACDIELSYSPLINYTL